MYRALALVGLALLLVAGTVYQNGRGTPEDSIILHFTNSPPVNVPHIGFVAPDDGRLLFLYATGHSPGTGAGSATYAAVRTDGGVMCTVDVPCNLQDGEHAPADGGVAECDPATASVDYLEHVEFEPLTACTTAPDLFLQAAFYYK